MVVYVLALHTSTKDGFKRSAYFIFPMVPFSFAEDMNFRCASSGVRIDLS